MAIGLPLLLAAEVLPGSVGCACWESSHTRLTIPPRYWRYKPQFPLKSSFSSNPFHQAQGTVLSSQSVFGASLCQQTNRIACELGAISISLNAEPKPAALLKAWTAWSSPWHGKFQRMPPPRRPPAAEIRQKEQLHREDRYRLFATAESKSVGR